MNRFVYTPDPDEDPMTFIGRIMTIVSNDTHALKRPIDYCIQLPNGHIFPMPYAYPDEEHIAQRVGEYKLALRRVDPVVIRPAKRESSVLLAKRALAHAILYQRPVIVVLSKTRKGRAPTVTRIKINEVMSLRYAIRQIKSARGGLRH